MTKKKEKERKEKVKKNKLFGSNAYSKINLQKKKSVKFFMVCCCFIRFNVVIYWYQIQILKKKKIMACM